MPMLKLKRFRKFKKPYKQRFIKEVAIRSNRPERKAFYTTTTSTVGTAGALVAIDQVAQGSSVNQRVGNAIVPRGLYVKAIFQGIDVTNNMRLIIFSRMQDAAATAVGAQFNGGAASTAENLDRANVKVYYDKTVTLNLMQTGEAAGVATFSPSEKVLQKYIRLKRHPSLRYNSNATAEPTRAAIQCIIISDSAGAPHPQYTLATVLFFKDP